MATHRQTSLLSRHHQPTPARNAASTSQTRRFSGPLLTAHHGNPPSSGLKIRFGMSKPQSKPGRLAYVSFGPEGQHDSSQARSAWMHKQIGRIRYSTQSFQSFQPSTLG